MSFGNALPVKLAISPTIRAGCDNIPFGNASEVKLHVSSLLSTCCDDKTFGNALSSFGLLFQ